MGFVRLSYCSHQVDDQREADIIDADVPGDGDDVKLVHDLLSDDVMSLSGETGKQYTE